MYNDWSPPKSVTNRAVFGLNTSTASQPGLLIHILQICHSQSTEAVRLAQQPSKYQLQRQIIDIIDDSYDREKIWATWRLPLLESPFKNANYLTVMLIHKLQSFLSHWPEAGIRSSSLHLINYFLVQKWWSIFHTWQVSFMESDLIAENLIVE